MSVYHGWTHRPKALGGTDPIELDLPRATLFVSGGKKLTGDNYYFNDPDVFQSHFGISSDGSILSWEEGTDYLLVHQPGRYLITVEYFVPINSASFGTLSRTPNDAALFVPVIGQYLPNENIRFFLDEYYWPESRTAFTAIGVAATWQWDNFQLNRTAQRDVFSIDDGNTVFRPGIACKPAMVQGSSPFNVWGAFANMLVTRLGDAPEE